MEIVDYDMYVNEVLASVHMSFETRTSDVLWHEPKQRRHIAAHLLTVLLLSYFSRCSTAVV